MLLSIKEHGFVEMFFSINSSYSLFNIALRMGPSVKGQLSVHLKPVRSDFGKLKQQKQLKKKIGKENKYN